jgi:oxalate decarboxylase/phosphoglucose isomerase-like protein (cupin superfamily)
MAGIETKSFDSPDEVREFEGNGHVDIVNVDGKAIGRGTFEPGWKWSDNVKPIAGTDSCQTYHLGYVLSGRMRVWMDDGGEAEVGEGDVMVIPPGHNAEVVGDEPVVTLEFGDAASYAKPA